MSDNDELEFYEVIAKVRDFHYAIAETYDKFVQTKAKAVTKDYDPEKIHWTPAQGERGPYQKSDDVNSPEYKALLKDLAAHGGKLQHLDYFYWTFQNGSTIGRKAAWKK